MQHTTGARDVFGPCPYTGILVSAYIWQKLKDIYSKSSEVMHFTCLEECNEHSVEECLKDH